MRRAEHAYDLWKEHHERQPYQRTKEHSVPDLIERPRRKECPDDRCNQDSHRPEPHDDERTSKSRQRVDDEKEGDAVEDSVRQPPQMCTKDEYPGEDGHTSGIPPHDNPDKLRPRACHREHDGTDAEGDCHASMISRRVKHRLRRHRIGWATALSADEATMGRQPGPGQTVRRAVPRNQVPGAAWGIR